MMTAHWYTTLSREAKKQYIRMRHSGQKRPSIIDAVDALVLDLNSHGPVLTGWPNYGIVHKNKRRHFHHCHLKKGKPTYVACWEVIDEDGKKIEVFYVGTHEGAPY